jgi:hypothetical protein
LVLKSSEQITAGSMSEEEEEAQERHTDQGDASSAVGQSVKRLVVGAIVVGSVHEGRGAV